MASTTQVPRSAYARLTAAAGAASYLDSGIIVSGGIALAIWQKAFGLSPLLLGVISASLTLSIAVGALIGGRIADVFGRRRLFTIDILIFAIGALVVTFAVGPVMIIVGVVIAGLAAGADLPTSLAVVSDLAPDGARGRLIGSTQILWSVGVLVATVLGFGFSGLGLLGVRLLYGHLVLIALAAWSLRVFSRKFKRLESQADHSGSGDVRGRPATLRRILTQRRLLRALALTGAFYIVWNLLANTLGQFQTYFLVTASGASQPVATAVGLTATGVCVITGIVFARVVDTRYRSMFFVAGAIIQTGAMVLGAVTGGAVLGSIVVMLLLYNASLSFAGEGMYKVWTQETFPAEARATTQGFTLSVSRLICAAAALGTPALVAAAPGALLWLLVVCAALTGLIGFVLLHGSSAERRAAGQEPPAVSAP